MSAHRANTQVRPYTRLESHHELVTDFDAFALLASYHRANASKCGCRARNLTPQPPLRLGEGVKGAKRSLPGQQAADLLDLREMVALMLGEVAGLHAHRHAAEFGMAAAALPALERKTAQGGQRTPA